MASNLWHLLFTEEKKAQTDKPLIMSASWYALFYQAAILLKIFSPALHFLCAVQGAKLGMAKVPL